MEIIIGIIIVGLGYAMYRAYQPKPTVTETAVLRTNQFVPKVTLLCQSVRSLLLNCR
jgi:hypothetical protein